MTSDWIGEKKPRVRAKEERGVAPAARGPEIQNGTAAAGMTGSRFAYTIRRRIEGGLTRMMEGLRPG